MNGKQMNRELEESQMNLSTFKTTRKESTEMVDY